MGNPSHKIYAFGLLLIVLKSIFAANTDTNGNFISYGRMPPSIYKKRQTTCNHSSPHPRTDCGWPGITVENCLKMECCSDTINPNKTQCFIPEGGLYTTGKMCVFKNTQGRRYCGYKGISKAKCEARDCCYDNRVQGGIPNCFFNTYPKPLLLFSFPFWKTKEEGILKNDIESLKKAEKKSIDALYEVRRKIKKAHTDYSISRTVGSSVSIGGAVATTAGILLAPFTGGISLGLTIGGITAGILGGGTTITTGIIEAVKLKEWENELIAAFGDQERELKRIAEKIVSFPEWTDITKQAVSSTVSISLKGASAYTVATIFRYLSITNVQYGDAAKIVKPIEDILNPSFWKSTKYLSSAKDVKDIAIPGGFLLKEEGLLNSFLGKVGLPALEVGATALKSITVGVGVVGIGFDIYNIVDTWVNDPKLVGQIDELLAYLEKCHKELGNFQNDLLY